MENTPRPSLDPDLQQEVENFNRELLQLAGRQYQAMQQHFLGRRHQAAIWYKSGTTRLSLPTAAILISKTNKANESHSMSFALC